MQKINPVHLDVKEHWRGWVSDAFHLYKSFLITNKAIMLIALLFIYMTNSLESFFTETSYIEWISFLFLRVIVSAYLITYILGMAFKYDKKSPEITIDLEKETMKRFFKVNLVMFAVYILSYALTHLFSVSNNVQAWPNSVELTYVETLFVKMRTDVFYQINDLIIMSFIIIYTYMKKSVMITISHIHDAVFKQGNFLFAIAMPFMIIMFMNTIRGFGSYSSVLYFILLPFTICLYYVVFKHMFFGMEPSKRESTARNSIFSTA